MKKITCSICHGEITYDEGATRILCPVCGGIYLVRELEKSPEPRGEEARLLTEAEKCLKNGNWKRARSFADQALAKNPACARAFLLRVCATRRVRAAEKLVETDKQLGLNHDFQRAMRCADVDFRRELQSLSRRNQEHIERSRREAAEREAREVQERALREAEAASRREAEENAAREVEEQAWARRDDGAEADAMRAFETGGIDRYTADSFDEDRPGKPDDVNPADRMWLSEEVDAPQADGGTDGDGAEEEVTSPDDGADDWDSSGDADGADDWYCLDDEGGADSADGEVAGETGDSSEEVDKAVEAVEARADDGIDGSADDEDDGDADDEAVGEALLWLVSDDEDSEADADDEAMGEALMWLITDDGSGEEKESSGIAGVLMDFLQGVLIGVLVALALIVALNALVAFRVVDPDAVARRLPPRVEAILQPGRWIRSTLEAGASAPSEAHGERETDPELRKTPKKQQNNRGGGGYEDALKTRAEACGRMV